MPKLVWSVVCKQAITDELSRNVSLVEVVEQIQVMGSDARAMNPILLPCCVVNLWTRTTWDEPETAVQRLRWLMPNGNSVVGPESIVRLDPTRRVRIIIEVGELSTCGTGVYYFKTEARREDSQEWIEHGRTPIQIDWVESKSVS